jgi:hypothetical protein
MGKEMIYAAAGKPHAVRFVDYCAADIFEKLPAPIHVLVHRTRDVPTNSRLIDIRLPGTVPSVRRQAG